jgi:hypothetical protein
MGRIVSERRRYLAVAACAVVVCAGAAVVGVVSQTASASRLPTAPSGGSVIGGVDGGGGLVVNAPGMWFAFNGAWESSASPVGIDQVMPRAGIARALHVHEQHEDPPTSVGALTFTIWKNDAATGVTCEVPVGSTSCSDDVDLARFAEGDRITLRLSSSVTVDAGDVSWSAVYQDGR